MKKYLVIGRGFRSISTSVLFSLSALLLLPAPADALDKSGWMTMASEIIGDDVSCGAGYVKHELVFRNLDTGALATPPNATFRVYDDSDNLADQASGSGVSTVGPVCFHPDNDSMEINVPDNGSYYPFSGGYVWSVSDAPSVPRGKFMRTTAWLRPKSDAGFDYRHVDPSGVYLNASPTYQVVLNDFPSTYGATGVSRILLFVHDWNSGAAVIRTGITGASVNGGTGTKTLPAQTLPDGIYTWQYYLDLNGNNALGGGFSTPNVLHTQRSGTNFPFVLDTVAPQFTAATTHSPLAPSASDQVTITGAATDSFSGITQVEIYLDGALAKTCPYFYVNSASCSVMTGPFLAGSTHSYYAVATDGAGNRATSPTQSFTVGIPGVCGPAHDNFAAVAPSGAAQLCSAGVPSSDPAVDGVGSYTWMCLGPDGVTDSPDDAICSAPKGEAYKICLNSCDSGSLNFNGGTIVLAPNETRNLRMCRSQSTAVCDMALGDITDEAGTVFDATNAPNDAVALTATKGQVQANASASGDTEVVNVSNPFYPANLSVTFAVPNICVRDCANAPNVCQGETFDDANGCGTNNCEGSRSCDFNWKEVAPGN